MRSMVEGGLRKGRRWWRGPSTPTLRVAVPLPVPGRM
ncbi:hypothetical protein S2M10_08560 [Sphingomonas sp. S2M10]|nr:hypothetical protein [Sphingomonas sp. S2M10]